VMQTSLPDLATCKIAVVGLGYVGLPLAVEFAKNGIDHRTHQLLKRQVIAFDVNVDRISQLRSAFDGNCEISKDTFSIIKDIEFTANKSALDDADVYIITVPTPIDNANNPDISPVLSATRSVGSAMKRRMITKKDTIPIIIYESTVYPGLTEDVCVPLLESESGCKFNSDFVCGYSPERINPGDTEHTLTSIVKVTSGSTEESADWIDNLYASIIKAGTYKAGCIKNAEAAKIIENIQRDVNIGLINEFSIIFSKMGLDTLDILKIAGSKWNFLKFEPGLVGGHCIGVDPYYMTYKAAELGLHPQLILAGRRINDEMSSWVTHRLISAMVKRSLFNIDSKVLLLGCTFKEDCPDIRNSKTFDIINNLLNLGVAVDIVDPYANPIEVEKKCGINPMSHIEYNRAYHAIILCVRHSQYMAITSNQWKLLKINENAFIYDLKGIVPRELNPIRP